jgi:hypothetical protein
MVRKFKINVVDDASSYYLVQLSSFSTNTPKYDGNSKIFALFKT